MSNETTPGVLRLIGKIHPEGASFAYKLSTAIITVSSLLFAFLVFDWISADQQQKAQARFNELSQHVAISLERQIRRTEDTLTSIVAFYAASKNVSRREFGIFVSQAMSDRVGVQALEWIPRVSHQARESYKRAAQKDGLKNFAIRQKGETGMETASTRDEYFPVYYVVPMAGNEKAVGFDLASNPARRAALEQARDTGMIVSSARITLVQEAAKQAGVVVFAPMYSYGEPIDTVSQKRAALSGFALGVFRIGDLLESSVSGVIRKNDFVIALFDASDSNNLLPMHMIGGDESVFSTPVMEQLSGDAYQKQYRFGSRDWRLVVVPQGGALLVDQPWLSWLVATGILVFLALIGGLFQILVQRRAYAEDLVIKRTREIERHIKSLRQSNEELEKFAYVASHDLQEPLRKVQAFGDRLKRTYSDVLDVKGVDYLSRMQNAAARMSVLINDLLNFSRITTQGQSFEPTDLGKIVDGVLSDLEVLIEETGARIEVGELPTIEADPLQTRQLFQNLIGNAIKYRKADRIPQVAITAEILEQRKDPVRSVTGMCVIWVEDNGIGFSDDHADQIFEIFQRLHGRDEYQGTGVGLAIARRIAERHGGGIKAEGRPGEGATFIVSLKAQHEHGEAAENE